MPFKCIFRKPLRRFGGFLARTCFPCIWMNDDELCSPQEPQIGANESRVDNVKVHQEVILPKKESYKSEVVVKIEPTITEPNPELESNELEVSEVIKEVMDKLLEDLENLEECALSKSEPELDPKKWLKTADTLDQQSRQDCLDRVGVLFQVTDFKQLGEGNYGVVYACKSTKEGEDGVMYAVKIVTSEFIYPEEQRDDWAEMADEEVNCLRELSDKNHENFVKLYDYAYLSHHKYPVKCYLAIKTELLDCTLAQVLKSRKLTFEQVAHLMVSLCGAVSWMAEQGYAHHDIKPENIMFKNLELDGEDFDAAFREAIPKIVDFGMASHHNEGLEDAKFDCNERGTELYCSPEKMDENCWLCNPFKCDDFALAVTLLQCLIPRISKDNTEQEKQLLNMFFSLVERKIDALDLYRQQQANNPELAKWMPYLDAIEMLIQPEVADRMHVSEALDYIRHIVF